MKECKVVNAFYSNCLYCCEVDDCEIASVAKLLAEAKEVKDFSTEPVVENSSGEYEWKKATFWTRRR